jgi:hypothetical protein
MVLLTPVSVPVLVCPKCRLRRGPGIARHRRASVLTRLRDGRGIWGMRVGLEPDARPPRQAPKNHAFFEHADPRMILMPLMRGRILGYDADRMAFEIYDAE